MRFNLKIDAVHEGKPANINLEVEFDQGEYLEAMKQMPLLISQLKELLKNKPKTIKKG